MSLSMKVFLSLILSSILLPAAASLAGTGDEDQAVARGKIELSQIKQKLSSLERKIQAQTAARANEKKKITEVYKNGLAMAKADYEAATKRLEKRAKDAGVNGFNSLFADKKKKAIRKSLKEEEAKVKAKYNTVKARVEADYKSAKTRLAAKAKIETKEGKYAKARLEKDYKQKVADINLAAKAKVQEEERLEAKAKAKAKAEAVAKKKAEVDEKKQAKAAAKAKVQAEERLEAEAKAKAKAELAAVETERKSNLANAEEVAKGQGKVRVEEKNAIEKDYKDAIAKAEYTYNAANKRAKKQAKDAGVGGFGSMFAGKKKAAILKSINDAKAKIKAEYEIAKADAKADRNQSVASLELKVKSDVNKLAQDRERIAKDYNAEKAKIDRRLKAEEIAAKAKVQEAKKAKAQARAKAQAEIKARKRADAEEAKKVKTDAVAKKKAEQQQGKEIKAVLAKAKERKDAAIAQAIETKKLRLSKLEAKSRADSKVLAEELIAEKKEYKDAKAKARVEYKDRGAVKKSKAGSEIEREKVQAKTDIANAQKKKKLDFANIDKIAKRQAKTRAEAKKTVGRDYIDALAKAESAYKAANKRVVKRAKGAGVDGIGAMFAGKKKAAILKSINDAKAKIKAEYESVKANAKADRNQSITALDSEARSNAKQTADEKTRVASDYDAVKSEIDLRLKAVGTKAVEPTAKEKTARKTEYEQALAKVEAEYKKTESYLQEKKKQLADDNAAKKFQAEVEYKEAISEANLIYKYENAKAQFASVDLPEDESSTFAVKEIKFSGNSLISEAELLEKLPLVYTVDGKDVYDFQVLHKIIVDRDHDIEREVSLRTIQGLNKYILSIYQNKGYAGIYVYVPVEAVDPATETIGKKNVELTGGILNIAVLEGRVAEIVIERYDFDRNPQEKGFLKKSVLESWSPIKKGDVVQKNTLDDFVRLLNLNPDRYISAVISRSADPDALNLGYDVYETSPWHQYIQVDNAGTKDRQWSPRIGVINTNLTGIDDKFSVMYQAPWEKGIEEEYSLYGSYDFPVFTPRLRLNLYGGYSQFDITPDGGTGLNFIGNGSFYGGILNFNVFQADGWFFDVTGSVSHERSKNTPSLGIASDVNMDLWGVGVNVHRSGDDNMSNTSFSFNRNESYGGSDEADFALTRLGTVPDFTIYNFAAAHSQYLETEKISRFSGSFRMITSNERLVPAKMTTFGGLYSVRGYHEDEIVADGGVLISGQYEFDLVKHCEAMENRETESEEKRPWLRKFAPLAFVDYGRAKMKDPVVGEQEVRELCSVGGGLLVELGDNLSAAAYYGWPLRGTADTEKGNGRLNLNVVVRW